MRTLPVTLFAFKTLRMVALLWLSQLALLAQAQTFKIDCDAEASIPQLDNKKLAPAKITIELQNIGSHVYFNVVGPTDYQMRVSSLVTEQYLGANLMTAARLGANKKNRTSGRENQITIDRESVAYAGYNDTDYQGKSVRIMFEGKCKLPRQ
ncbi:MAG: hypothetical protein RLZZ296_1079 [Pseudomonadota bacterium]|jgi:hypothetical protein